MKSPKPIVVGAAVVLFGTWMAANFSRLTGDDDGLIRFVLGGVLSLLILLRWKQPGEVSAPAAWVLPTVGAGGALLTVLGLVFRVHQVEWLGVVLLLYACLRWTLPGRYAGDIRLALFLLYWVHPLPGQVFGKFTLAMQWLSVQGAEWLLQTFNQRIWADGMLLHGGFRAFGVPESCSGMRTAVTVLLCTLGSCTLFRLRWYETAGLLVLGLAQVLALNILRVSAMVYWAPRMPPEWADTFLHDTLGVFLLVGALLLVQAEVSGWKVSSDRRRRQKEGVARGERDQPDRATMLPRFWRMVFRWWLPTATALALAGAVAFAAYKRRPAHRVAMVKGVIESLLETDAAAAQRAIEAALRRAPRDRGLRGQRVHVLVMRGKFDEALRAMDELGSLSTMDMILKSWALMAAGRSEEAIKTVDALPESARTLPGVAIIRAEYAALHDRPQDAARCVVLAAARQTLIRRIRGLYPYLASREQWPAIADSDHALPYADVNHALISVHANLKIRRAAGAMRALTEAQKSWPNDPRFLSALFAVAVQRPGGEWEERAAASFMANAASLDADRLAGLLKECFSLHRPDLAWLGMARLQALDPADPALFLTPARHAEEWFVFRKRQLGVKAEEKDELVDLRPVYLVTRHLGRYAGLWAHVPLVAEMAGASPDVIRSKYLSLCIDELLRREKAGSLSHRMQLMFPTALAMSGRFDDAHGRLVRLAERYPELAGEVLYQQAALYAQEEKWEASYEALRQHFVEVPEPALLAHMLLVNVLMNLNLGIGAMDVTQRVAERFPDSPQMRVAEAGIWDVFGFRDHALHLLSRSRERDIDPRILAQLMAETGRVKELDRITRIRGLAAAGKAPKRSAVRQPLLLPAAELAVMRRLPPPMTDAERAEEARLLRGAMSRAISPYVRAVQQRTLEWLSGDGAAPDLAAWKACGRDSLEQAASLHGLGVLLARQQRDAEARAAVEQASALLPRSAVLWRLRVALSDGDRQVVDAARQACPEDPELWLASLVVRARADGPGPWAAQEIGAAAQTDAYSPETFVRAGNFFLRTNLLDAAVAAARHATSKGRGLVPAYVLGIQCALATNDLPWAMSSAREGAENALDPSKFYMTIVDIKSAGQSTDADMIGALEYLNERFPREVQWGEHLGFVYFQKRDTKRTLSVFEDLMKGDFRKLRVESVILAAEAARLEGEGRKAAAILENAHAAHPESIAILNNLVYSLTQEERTLPRARQLLPALLEKGSNSFVVLDTAAMVYLKSGQLDQAKAFMERAIEKFDDRDYSALEATLNSAEVLFRLSKYEEARAIVERIRKDPARSTVVDLAARDLMARIREKTERKK